MAHEVVLRNGIRIKATLPSGTGDNLLTVDGATFDVGSIAAIDTSVFLSKTLASANIYVGNGSNVGTAVAVSGDVTLDNTGNVQIVAGAIVNADVNASAAIAYSKLAALTVSRAVQTNAATGFLEVSSVTNTELGYVSGVTSAIQTQLNAKAANTESFVVISLSGNLTSERSLAVESSVLSLTDGGANASVTLGIAALGVTDAKIANSTITYGKIQNVSAASRLLGRGDSGAGSPQEITLGSGLTMTGTTLSSSAGTPGGATDELQENNGAGGFRGTKVFSTADGNLTLGDSGLAGSARTIDIAGSASNIDATITPKGTGNVNLNFTSGGKLLLGTSTGASRTITAFGSATDVALILQPQGAGAVAIDSSAGVNLGDSSTTGSTRTIQATGSVTNIDVYLAPKGAGNLSLMSASPSFASGEKVVFVPNATTVPTGTPSGGGVLYANAGVIYWRDSSGVSYNLTAGGSPGGATNEIQKNSAGTFAGTKVFSAADGDVTLGDSGLAGSGRTIQVAGSSSNIILYLYSKGSAPISMLANSGMTLTDQAGTYSITFVEGSASTNPTITGGRGVDRKFFISSDSGENGSVVNGVSILVDPGDAYSVSGDGNGGDAYINTGLRRAAGTGRDGNLGLLTDSVSNWQSMSRGIFAANAVTAPTGNPASGLFVWSSSTEPEGSNIKVRTSSGHFGKPILQAKTTIAGGSTLRNIGSTPQTVVAAPGSNKFLNIMQITVSYNYNSAVYNFTANGVFRFAGAGSTGWLYDSSNLNAGADLNVIVQEPSNSSTNGGGIQAASNTAFQLGTTDNSNATTGDGDIDVVVYYTVEDSNV